MVHSSTTESFTPTSQSSNDETSYAFADREDDDDTSRGDGLSVYAEPPEGEPGQLILLTRKDGHCMRIYSTSGSAVLRVCGCKGICHRVIPSAHKTTNVTAGSHAPDGLFMSLPVTRKGSPILDGLLDSHRSEEDHRADLQDHSDANQTMAHYLAATSPANSRSFRNEECLELGKTPVRHNRSPRFAQPPNITPGGMSVLGSGSAAGAHGGPAGRSQATRPPTSAARPAVIDTSPPTDLEAITQLIMAGLKSQAAFQEQVAKAFQLAAIAPVITTINDDSDDLSTGGHGSKTSSKNRQSAARRSRKKKEKTGKRGKNPPSWYGVVAGQEGSLHSTMSSAKAYARGFDPRGRISPKFDTKAEAREWLVYNLDDPNSSDTASTGETTEGSDSDTSVDAPRSTRGSRSRMVPPGRLADTEESPFKLVTQDPSTGKKNELFGVEIKKERDVFRALAPKGTSDEVQRSLAECIVDGTALPGTFSEIGGMEEGGQDTQLAETLSRVLGENQARGIVGASRTLDTGYKSKARVSLKGVKSLDDLQALEQELGLAIPAALENMKLAFGSALDPLGWTVSQEATYLLGGHFPYISTAMMRYYSDLVRELARRSVHGWARAQIDITYFVKKLVGIRTNGSSRFLVLVRTYIFLRDQQAVGFASIDRMNSHLNGLYECLAASTGKKTDTEKTVMMCQNCKQKGLHKGGRPGCPFRGLDEATARKAGTFAAEKCATGSTKTQAYELALIEFPTST